MISAILSVLLTILKIIGIILLIILGLFLFVILSLLFIPLRYKGKGAVKDAGMKGDIRLSWFLHFLSVRIEFHNEKVKYYIRVFGIKIRNSDKLKNSTRKVKKQKTDKKQKIVVVKDKEEELKVDSSIINKENINININETVPQNNLLYKKVKEEDDESSKKSIKQKIIDKLLEIKFKFIKICDKIRNVNKIKESYIDFLTTEESRKAIGLIKYRLFKIFNHIKPTKLRTNISFGFENPATTGQVFGVLSFFLGMYGKNILIDPQFENVEKFFLEGSFKFKGRIRLIILLVNGLKIYRNKRLKEFLNFVKG